jgi:uncharacterized protein (TIGR02246 family)
VNIRFILCNVLLALSACSTTPHEANVTTFDDAEIRLAERALEAALSSSNPLAWVEHYTEDAIFVAPGAPAVQGREALTRMAQAMRPLSAVQIRGLKTEGSSTVAAVYGRATWVNGAGTSAQSTTNVRLVIVWRKGSDGRWRVAQELLHAEPSPE